MPFNTSSVIRPYNSGRWPTVRHRYIRILPKMGRLLASFYRPISVMYRDRLSPIHSCALPSSAYLDHRKRISVPCSP